MKNKIINGDCIEEMKKMSKNSIDTIICDPPYDLTSIVKRFGKENSAPAKYGTDGVFQRSSKGFMGKTWDGTGIAFGKGTWEEMLRVAKPGATLLSFGGTRTYHRMACAIEDAGWVIKDCIMWIYGSGFPKSLNIGKSLDKKMGKKRKVVGKKKTPSGQKYPENYDKNSELFDRASADITEPATPEAKQWEGWGTALKPSYEPILVAVKPNDGSYANNALKRGVAGLNIDGSRIGIDVDREPDTGDSYYLKRNKKYPDKGSSKIMGQKSDRVDITLSNGRFPANIILDEEAGKILDEQSGDKYGQLAPTTGKEPSASKKNQIYGDYSMVARKPSQPRGLSGASRFFYCAKASKAERNTGCEGLEEKIQDRMRPDKSEPTGLNKDPKWAPKPSRNNHPTVKPLKLMEYLCILTKTPTGGIVLDPFAGSGTTCMAAKMTGRDFIGIEKEAEYCKIAEARINAVQKPLL